jgi:hypothetical protein
VHDYKYRGASKDGHRDEIKNIVMQQKKGIAVKS